MYIPDHYREARLDVLHSLMRAHPLGTLVTHTAEGLDANHIPFELAADEGEHGVLRAHVARNNPVWRQIDSGTPVMVVFRGPEAYISPSWYPSKHEAHRQVPTWNYEVVHVHGRLQVMDDEHFVRGLVARLTREHEATEAVPWKMGDSPQDFINHLLTLIVGIELHIDRVEGKRKLSQNKEARDIQGAAEALHAREQHGVAAAMQQFLPPQA